MCGLAGFSHLPKSIKAFQRWALVEGLGKGIDRRGGHASGYVGTKAGKASHQVSHKLGRWDSGNLSFTLSASKHDVVVMHARYATCGAKELVTNAHPFTVKRDGKSVLYGAHNGMLEGTYATANKGGRKHTVDSREFFELLADGDIKAIQGLTGYGVVTWLVPGSDVMLFARLSSHSDFVIGTLEGGGVVWASTETILKDALEEAGLEWKTFTVWEAEEVGRVYEVRDDKVFLNDRTDVKVGAKYKYTGSGAYGVYGGSDAYDWTDWSNWPDYKDNDSDTIINLVGGSRKRISDYDPPLSRGGGAIGEATYWNRQDKVWENRAERDRREAEELAAEEAAWNLMQAARRSEGRPSRIDLSALSKRLTPQTLLGITEEWNDLTEAATPPESASTEEAPLPAGAKRSANGRYYTETSANGMVRITTVDGMVWERQGNTGHWKKVTDSDAAPDTEKDVTLAILPALATGG